MTTALIVTSSANGDASVSTGLATTLVDRLREADPSVRTVLRDVGANPLPHLTADTVAAIKGEPKTEAELSARALSDALVTELAEADILVIASPMYNFGMSSTLKAWFDHVLRAGVTFRYTSRRPRRADEGQEGGGDRKPRGFYSEGAGAAMDGQEPHIRILLGFMGIDEVTFVRAEKLAFGPEAAEAAIAEASEALGIFAGETLKLAA